MVDIRVGQTTVPDPLLGLEQAAAEAALAEADLNVAYATSQYSATYDAGTIMAADATEGADIDPGSTVTLTVSLGEEPEETALEEGGLRKRRRHYYVEIDHQRFTVNSPAEAQALLAQARDMAQAHAERLAQQAAPKVKKVGKKPVALPTPQISSPNPELKSVIREARTEINAVYRQAALDAELALLLSRRMAEEDEEEALLFLM